MKIYSWLRLNPGSLPDFEKLIVQTSVKGKPAQEPGATAQVWHAQ